MTHRSSNQTQRGFSLTEVLVAVAVFAVIFIAALMVYDRANKIFKTGVDASDVQQTTRVAFERMVADVRMAGFDFDRDGYPTGSKKYQQPDEQLEFIHPHALTMRTNLNYETAAGNDNGRETAYEPGFATAGTTDDDFFPVVTTANNEIVTYALKSDNGANDDSITFFADIQKPRRAYPDVGAVNETLVTIPNVDLCQDNAGVLTGCMEPPYTLYRITLKDDGTPDTPVPIANNIRSVTYSYFADALTTAAVVPNGGVGQWIVTGGTTTTTSISQRELRGGVRAIRMNLTGMSPSADPSYTEPIETALPTAQQVAAARNRRQYSLQSTIVPRNLGKRGVQEIDIRVPGAPLITNVCVEGCGAPRVQWDAPAVGYVDAYLVFYDTSPTGAFNSPGTDAGRNRFAYVEGLDPSLEYWFKVVAKNDFGSEFSARYPATGVGTGIRPINRTDPKPPVILTVTGNGGAGMPAAVPNDITVTWRAPFENVGGPALPLNSCGNPAAGPLPKETLRYKVLRSETAGVAGTEIWTGAVVIDVPGTAVLDDGTGIVTFTDNFTKKACTMYYYTVIGVERCNDNGAWNQGGNPDLAISEVSNEMGGQASAGGDPKVPQNVVATGASTCSTNPCSIFLEWDEVVQDENDKPILVTDYTVQRVTHVAGIPGAVQTFPVTDVTPGDGLKVTFNDTTAPQPPIGTIYHYTVSATHCSLGTPLTSAYSSPDAKFPCAILTPSIVSANVLDGDGSPSGPWIVNDSNATIDVSSNTDLTTATATVYDYPARATSTVIVGTLVNPRLARFTFPMPGNDDAFEFVMQFTDALGCSSSVIRYVQESASNCCLLPFKDSSGLTTLNPTVLTLGPASNQLTLLLQNQCDDILTIDTLHMTWDVVSNPTKELQSVTYPGGITQTIAPASAAGTIVLNPGAQGASTTIPAGGSYQVILTFTRTHGQGLGLTTIGNFCARHSRAGFIGLTDCRVAQIPNTSCP